MFYDVPDNQHGLGTTHLINVSHVVGFFQFSSGSVSALLDARRAKNRRWLVDLTEETMVLIKAKIRESGRAMVSVQLENDKTFHFCIEDLLAIRQLHHDNHWTDIILDASKLADTSEFQISNEKAAELKKEIMLIQREQEKYA